MPLYAPWKAKNFFRLDATRSRTVIQAFFTQILHNYYKKNIHNCRHGFHIVPTIQDEWSQIICDVILSYWQLLTVRLQSIHRWQSIPYTGDKVYTSDRVYSGGISVRTHHKKCIVIAYAYTCGYVSYAHNCNRKRTCGCYLCILSADYVSVVCVYWVIVIVCFIDSVEVVVC